MASRAGLRPTATNQSHACPAANPALCTDGSGQRREQLAQHYVRQRLEQLMPDLFAKFAVKNHFCHKRGSAQCHLCQTKTDTPRLRAGLPQRVLREDPHLRSIGLQHAFHAIENCPKTRQMVTYGLSAFGIVLVCRGRHNLCTPNTPGYWSELFLIVLRQREAGDLPCVSSHLVALVQPEPHHPHNVLAAHEQGPFVALVGGQLLIDHKI